MGSARLPAVHSRDKQNLGAFQSHMPVELRKADIVADAHTQLAKLRIHHGHMVTGADMLGFLAHITAGKGHVKEVQLLVAAHSFPLRVQQNGRIVVSAVRRRSKDSAAEDPDAVLLRLPRHTLQCGTVLQRLCGGMAAAVLGKVFREGDQLRPGGGRLVNETLRRAHAVVPAIGGVDLANGRNIFAHQCRYSFSSSTRFRRSQGRSSSGRPKWP